MATRSSFAPDFPALVEALPRISGRAPDLNARGISVRLEAIDTLETHFGETHQELAGANAARDELLARLGFTGVTFFSDLPNRVQSADQDRVRVHVLSNGIDANGRMIGFVYAGDAGEPDGADVFLDTERVDLSLNAQLVAAGQAYPAFYATLPVQLRDHFAQLSRTARATQPGIGLWLRSTADPDGAATVPDLAALEQLVMWPKLFRRIVPFLAAGFADFDGFDAWLRADPVNRDDAVFLLDRLEQGNMHDIVAAAGHTIMLTVWPEDFIIDPDPARPVPTPAPTAPAVIGDLLIVAVLADPAGSDTAAETVTLLNTSASALDLTGWSLADAAGGRQSLTGNIGPGDTLRVPLTNAVQLSNQGDTILLADTSGQVISQVTYTRNQIRPGRSIKF